MVYLWAALVLICTTSFIPFVLNVSGSGLHWPLDPGSPTNYLMFLFLGYYLSHREISRPWRIVLYALSLTGLLAHLLGTYFLSILAGMIVQTFKSYLNLPGVLYAVGIFVFFKEHGNAIMRAFPGKIVRALAPHTFSIYLLHWFMLVFIQMIFSHFGIVVDTSLWYRLGAVVVIVPLVMAVDWVARKIPVIKHLLPA